MSPGCGVPSMRSSESRVTQGIGSSGDTHGTVSAKTKGVTRPAAIDARETDDLPLGIVVTRGQPAHAHDPAAVIAQQQP